MTESECHVAWSTWGFMLDIIPRSWEKRKQEEPSAEDWYRQDDEGIEESLHEARYQQSFGDGRGAWEEFGGPNP